MQILQAYTKKVYHFFKCKTSQTYEQNIHLVKRERDKQMKAKLIHV